MLLPSKALPASAWSVAQPPNGGAGERFGSIKRNKLSANLLVVILGAHRVRPKHIVTVQSDYPVCLPPQIKNFEWACR